MLFGIPVPQQAPFLGGIATEATQILNHGQLLVQYIRQGRQLTTSLQQYAEIVRNGRALPSQVFGPIQADLSAMAICSP
jgi:P-type conjugative transfer protein TrbJ